MRCKDSASMHLGNAQVLLTTESQSACRVVQQSNNKQHNTTQPFCVFAKYSPHQNITIPIDEPGALKYATNGTASNMPVGPQMNLLGHRSNWITVTSRGWEMMRSGGKSKLTGTIQIHALQDGLNHYEDPEPQKSCTAVRFSYNIVCCNILQYLDFWIKVPGMRVFKAFQTVAIPSNLTHFFSLLRSEGQDSDPKKVTAMRMTTGCLTSHQWHLQCTLKHCIDIWQKDLNTALRSMKVLSWTMVELWARNPLWYLVAYSAWYAVVVEAKMRAAHLHQLICFNQFHLPNEAEVKQLLLTLQQEHCTFSTRFPWLQASTTLAKTNFSPSCAKVATSIRCIILHAVQIESRGIQTGRIHVNMAGNFSVDL